MCDIVCSWKCRSAFKWTTWDHDVSSEPCNIFTLRTIVKTGAFNEFISAQMKSVKHWHRHAKLVQNPANVAMYACVWRPNNRVCVNHSVTTDQLVLVCLKPLVPVICTCCSHDAWVHSSFDCSVKPYNWWRMWICTSRQVGRGTAKTCTHAFVYTACDSR